jgi:hypothetical protein
MKKFYVFIHVMIDMGVKKMLALLTGMCMIGCIGGTFFGLALAKMDKKEQKRA